MKKYISLIIFMVIIIFITSCGTNTPSSTSKTNISSPAVGTITAYQGTVHKQVLTSHAIDILLLPENPGNLTKKQLTLLKTFRNDIEQGVWDEDYNNPYGLPNTIPIFRTINHFMDPQHGNIALSDPPFSGTPYSAIDWVYNGDSSMYLTAKQNFVVNITGYDPNNTLMNTSGLKISMTDLGHVLHMFQDMSVPPHVRNDNHSGLFGASSSRYEDIGLSADPGININTMSPINITNDDDLYSQFIYLARTTSENFFSEDTIPDPNNPPPLQRQFPLPTLPSGIGYLPNQNAPLVIAELDKRTTLIKYKLNDVNDTIPKYYASQLMPKAISYSAGVIKYFLSLKGTGEVIINSHTDGQHVTSTPITVSGYLTYYAPEVAISIPNGTAIRTVVHASTTLSGGHYAFSYPVNLYDGSNQITVTAYNENVEPTSATVDVIYQKTNDPNKPFQQHPHYNPNAKSPIKVRFDKLCGTYTLVGQYIGVQTQSAEWQADYDMVVHYYSDYQISLIYPDGTSEVLMTIPHYHQGWTLWSHNLWMGDHWMCPPIPPSYNVPCDLLPPDTLLPKDTFTGLPGINMPAGNIPQVTNPNINPNASSPSIPFICVCGTYSPQGYWKGIQTQKTEYLSNGDRRIHYYMTYEIGVRLHDGSFSIINTYSDFHQGYTTWYANGIWGGDTWLPLPPIPSSFGVPCDLMPSDTLVPSNYFTGGL